MTQQQSNQPFLPGAVGDLSNKPCIVVESGRKSYGKLQVLRNVHMNVKAKSIYGLLGSSGCGKTTLLSTIVGIRALDRGHVFVCGNEPGSPGSGVPGKRVGYMPQEVALNMEFTVNEVCTYFGRIYGMDAERVQDRIEYLVTLLDLRKCKGQLKNLCGGQQRRASFAVALLHEPEILILDEPTVGVDPLLRASIWKHLRDLVAEFGTTVVITTHYIEEMRQADTVGIMRDGLILAEDSPTNLMTIHNAKMLEEVVLKFYMKGNTSTKKKPMLYHYAGSENHPSAICFYNEDTFNNNNSAIPNSPLLSSSRPQSNPWSVPVTVTDEHDDDVFDLESEVGKNEKKYQTKKTNILKALILKNILVIMRNIWFLIFLLLMPALVIVVFCLAIGPKPEDLPFGVINFEVPDGACANFKLTECKPTNLSCNFIHGLDSSLVKIKYLKSELEALELVDEKKLWGYVVLREGFSKSIFEKTFGKFKGFETNDSSQVEVRLDMTIYPIAQLLRKNVFDGYLSFTKTLAKTCQPANEMDKPTEYNLPINFKEPIYGSYDGEYTEFVAPGVAIGFIYFLAVITCGLAAITEKKDGMFNRCIVAGVTTLQIMVSHLITQFGIIFVQTCLVFLVMFTLIEVPAVGSGSVILGFALFILYNIAGMSLGLLFSTMFDEEKNAMLVGFAAVLPNLMLSGLMWPFEGLPPILRTIGHVLPSTFAAESLRSILLRGWGIDHFSVWIGFVIGAGWTVGAWVLLYIIQRSAHKK